MIIRWGSEARNLALRDPSARRGLQFAWGLPPFLCQFAYLMHLT